MIKILLFFFSFNTLGLTKSFEKYFKYSDSKLTKTYFKKLKKMKKVSCQKGDSSKYEDLFKAYKGKGFYLPKIDDQLDLKTIKDNLKLLENKKKWISNIRKRLKSYKRLPEISSELKEIDSLVKENLKLKARFQFKAQSSPLLFKEGRKVFERISKAFTSLESNIFYLLNFNFPVNHFENRRKYDEYKAQGNISSKNQMFFKRKIFEDGAPSSSAHSSDKYIRTNIDSIKIALKKNEIFLNPELTFDLVWLIDTLPKLRKKGARFYESSFFKWEERLNNQISSYKKILSGDQKDFTIRQNSNLKLEEFISSKQESVYSYWNKQKEFWKALYAFETILYNEVGAIDPIGLERLEVISVVMNRFKDKSFWSLDSTQNLMKLLKEKSNSKWLNVLFRKGQFSFTYYFIPGVKEVFCPNLSKWGKKLRENNIKLILSFLKKSKKAAHENATRYFSRASMVGRVDMSSIWSGYQKLPELPGIEKVDSNLLGKILKNDFVYWYSFKYEEKRYFVLQIDGIKYSVSWDAELKKYRIYGYRDPNLFRYFQKI